MLRRVPRRPVGGDKLEAGTAISKLESSKLEVATRWRAGTRRAGAGAS